MSVEAKLRSFVSYSISQLDSAEAELTDEDEETNYLVCISPSYFYQIVPMFAAQP